MKPSLEKQLPPPIKSTFSISELNLHIMKQNHKLLNIYHRSTCRRYVGGFRFQGNKLFLCLPRLLLTTNIDFPTKSYLFIFQSITLSKGCNSELLLGMRRPYFLIVIYISEIETFYFQGFKS